jgi:hypothetical protein
MLHRMPSAYCPLRALLVLWATGCGSQQPEPQTETVPAPNWASGGRTGESLLSPHPLCVHGTDTAVPETSVPEAPKTFGDSFVRQDSFGNNHWGGGYELNFDVRVTESASALEAQARADLVGKATLFGKKGDVARAVLNAHVQAGGETKMSADLVFLGKYVYPLFSATGSFVDGRAYTHQMLEVHFDHLVKTGVPVGLELAAWVTLGFTASGQAVADGLAGRFTPYVGAVATGSVGVLVGLGGINVVGGKLVGSVELVSVRAPFQAGLRFAGSDRDLRVDWSATSDLELHWLAGTLSAELEFIDNENLRLSQLLARWDGYRSSHRLGSGRGAVVLPLAPTECALEATSGGPSFDGDPSRLAHALHDPYRSLDAATWDDLILPLENLSELHPRDRAERLEELKRRLRHDPAAAGAMTAYLGGSAGPLLTAALGAAGTPAALEVLLDLAAGKATRDLDLRISAIAALGLSPRINGKAVRTLLALLRESTGALEETAAYALGNATASLAETAPNVAAEIDAELLARTEGVRTERDLWIAVRAASNAGDARTLVILRRIVAAQRPTVRLRSLASDVLDRATSALGAN